MAEAPPAVAVAEVTRFGFHPRCGIRCGSTLEGFAFEGEFRISDQRITFSHPNNIAALST